MGYSPWGRKESDTTENFTFTGKAGNPFQTTQGNRLSCRGQEGRRGSGLGKGRGLPRSQEVPWAGDRESSPPD